MFRDNFFFFLTIFEFEDTFLSCKLLWETLCLPIRLGHCVPPWGLRACLVLGLRVSVLCFPSEHTPAGPTEVTVPQHTCICCLQDMEVCTSPVCLVTCGPARSFTKLQSFLSPDLLRPVKYPCGQN